MATNLTGGVSPTTGGGGGVGVSSDINLPGIVHANDPRRHSQLSDVLSARTSSHGSGPPRHKFADRDLEFSWHEVRHNDARPDALLTSKGLGLTLLHGVLRRWDAEQGGWERVTDGVHGMCLGADGHTVYLRDGRHVVPMNADGTGLGSETAAFTVPPDVIDFAVMPDNQFALSLSPHLGGQRKLTIHARDGEACDIPVPDTIPTLKGVTVTNAGDVVLLDQSNVVHRITGDGDGNPAFEAQPATGLAAFAVRHKVDHDTSVFTPPPKAIDFAVMPDNKFAASLTPRGGGQCRLTVYARSGEARDIPVPDTIPKLKGVTITKAGDLMVLDRNDVVHRIAADGAANTVFVQQPATAADGPGARPRVENLRTLADGSIAAIAHDTKDLVRLSEDGGWHATDLNAPTAVEAFYSRLKGPMKVNLFGVAGFPWSAQNHQADKPWWKPAMFHKARPDQNLPVRWAKWMLAHQPIRNSGTATLNDVKAVREQMKTDRKELLRALPDGDRAVVMPREHLRMAVPVNESTGALLDKLERAVGLVDGEGNVKNRYAAPEKYRSYIRARSDQSNVLQAVLSFRKSFLRTTDGDPINKRLKRLVEHGVTLNADGGSHAGGKNDLGVLSGKLLQDHAALLRTHRAMPEPAEREPVEGPLETAQAQLQRQLGEGLLNDLYESGVHDIRTAHKTNRAVSKLSGGLAARFGKLRHAARAGGMLSGDIAKQYVRFVENLKPGQSITLQASTGAGHDGDGQAHVFQSSDHSKTHAGPELPKPWFSLNAAPNIQVLLTAAQRQEYQVQITKTDVGIKLQVGEANSTAARAGVKLSWAVGAAGAFKAKGGPEVTGIAVAGAEVIPELGATRSKGNAISLEIPNDGKGNVQRVVEDLFNGRASLESLIAEAEKVTPTRGHAKSSTAQAPAHLLAAGLIEGNVTVDGQQQQLRAVLAPVLSQVYFGAEVKKGRTVTGHGKEGGEINTVDRVDMAVQAKLITITEFQHQLLKPVPPTDNLGGPPLANGYAKQDKEPVLIFVLEKELWSKHLHNDASIRFKDDGSLASVGVQVGPKSKIKQRGKAAALIDALRPMDSNVLSPKNLPQLPALLLQQPGLQRYIDRMAEHGIQPTVHLELKPEVLAELNPGAPDFERSVKEAITHPANLRITSFDVQASNGYNTGVSFGRTFMRYSSAASNDFSTPAGRIEVSYPEGKAPQVKASGALMLGHRVAPNFKAFEVAQEAGGGADLLAAVLRPVRNEVTRMLVQQTAGHHLWTDADLIRGATRLMVNQNDPTTAFGHTRAHHHAPIENGRLGLLNGEMVYRRGDGALATVSSDLANHVLLHLGPNLLPLMASRSSGMLNTPAAMLDDIAERLENLERMPVEPTPQPTNTGMLRRLEVGRRMHIVDILQHLRDHPTTVGLRDLNPAERMIVAAFFPDRNAEQPIDEQRLGDTLSHHTLYNTFVQEIVAHTPARRPVHVAPTEPYGTPDPTEGSETAHEDRTATGSSGSPRASDTDQSESTGSPRASIPAIFVQDDDVPPDPMPDRAMDVMDIDPHDRHLLQVDQRRSNEGPVPIVENVPMDTNELQVVPDDPEGERPPQTAPRRSKWNIFRRN